MSKRLKKRILEVCGLNNLNREDRAQKASAILNDSEYKQKICNEIIGISHRDIEKTLKGLLTARAISKEEEIYQELEEEQAEKLYPDSAPMRVKKQLKLVPLLNKSEVNELIHATNEPLEEVGHQKEKNNSFYSLEDVLKMLS